MVKNSHKNKITGESHMLNRRWFMALTGVIGLLSLLAGGAVHAEGKSLKVVTSSTFRSTLEEVLPAFEARTGIKVELLIGPSMGATVDAIPTRLGRGEDLDVLVMIGAALDDLIKQGKVAADSKMVLAKSGIGIMVKAGAPHPDVSTPEALKQTLLAAKSAAWSDSASGVYIQKEMLAKLGIAEQVLPKGKTIPADPVGWGIAKGESEIGFQQLSELKPLKGIDILGPLPGDLQKISLVSAGVVGASKSADASRQLIAYLTSPEVKQAITSNGMEPVGK